MTLLEKIRLSRKFGKATYVISAILTVAMVVINCHGLKLLAEVTTTAISKSRKPDTFIESKAIAQEGGDVAKDARLNIEKRTGKKVISSANAKDKLQLDIKSED